MDNENIAREPLTRVQPASGLVGLRWESDDRRWWLEGSAQLVRHQDRLSPGDRTDTQRIPPGGTGGYSVYALRGGWSVTPQWTLTASVENVTDEDYRVHGSGLNEPGTNVVLSSQARFYRIPRRIRRTAVPRFRKSGLAAPVCPVASRVRMDESIGG